MCMVLLRARELGVSVFALMLYIVQHLTSSHYTHKGEFGITLIVTWTSEAKNRKSMQWPRWSAIYRYMYMFIY